MTEIVYALSNPAMPGLVKIGMTYASDVAARVAGLYSTGVPVPFTIEYACKVKSAVEVEKALHVAFGHRRVNPSREFFRIDPEQVVGLLKLLQTEDITQEVEHQPQPVDEESLDAAEQMKKKRPPLNFEEMGIPVGAVLSSTHGPATVVVAGPKKVKSGDEEISLTAATRQVLQIDYNVAPGPHWTYNGKTIRDYYRETYGEAE